jgi:hypothetical protein
MCYGLRCWDPKNAWKSERSGVDCHELKDLNGQSFANGLQITGPAPDGELLLRDSDKNVVAFMRPRRTSSSVTICEILCHHPREDAWFPWATVRQVPHTLEFELSLVNRDTMYTLSYCGPILGPPQMRIDEDGETRAYIQQSGSSWNIVIGPRVDPCLMVCFMAIVNQQ